MVSLGILNKLKETLVKLSKQDLPFQQDKDKTPSMNEILLSFNEYLNSLCNIGEEFEYFVKFCLGILDYQSKMLEDLQQTRKMLNSQNTYSKEEAYKANLIKQLRILQKASANKNPEVLHEMIEKVDKMFLKILTTIVFEKKIKWYECNFEEMKLKYVGESTQKGKTTLTDKFHYNYFCNIARFGNQKALIAGGQYPHELKKVAYAQILEHGQLERELGDKMSVERQKHSMITIENEIQMAGGTNARKVTLNDFQKLDTISLKWEELERMPNKRESFYMCEYRSRFIIVAGGFNGMHFLDSFELQNIKANTWATLNVRLPPVLNHRVGMERVGLAVDISESKDILYILGGSYNFGGGQEQSSQIWKCDMAQVRVVQQSDAEGEEELKLAPLELTEMILPPGELRMFDKIGSKCIMVIVDHPANDADKSLWHVLQLDFDDESKQLKKFKVDDHQLRIHENTDHLNPDDNDVQCGCLTF